MRRPMLILCIILIVISFVYTSLTDINSEEGKCYIEGVVTNIEESERGIKYRINDALIMDYNMNKKYRIGDILSVDGEKKDLSDLTFDDFNYGRYLKSKGINKSITAKKIEIVGYDRLYLIIGNIKEYIREGNRFLYKEKSDFINSMIIGEREFIRDEDDRLFSRTGVSHILAISGMHISILCALISMLSFITGKRINILLSTVFLSVYYFVSGGSVSVGRAVLSFFMYNICFFIDRKNDGINTLSAIASAMIISNFYVIYNTGFQLSFLATLSILYFYPKIKEIVKLSSMALTISANILTLPVIVYVFDGISVLSAVSNVLAVPFVSIIVYIDIISLLIMKLNVFLSEIIAVINYIIIDIIYFILDFVDGIWFSYVEFDKLGFSFVLIYYIIIFLGMKFYEIKVIREQKNGLQGYYYENKTE